MKTEVENVSDVKKIIHFEIPWEDVDKQIKTAVRTIARRARIPGFRPGKAPESVIRSRYAQHIKDEVINQVVPEAYQKALKENQFDIISEPSLHDVMYSEGSPFQFQVTIETKPKIELSDYKGIELKSRPTKVDDAEVEAVLNNFREQSAEIIPLADTAAATGHFIHARVKATVEGEKKPLFDNRVLIEIGSAENHPSFNEHLPGHKAGDTVTFDAAYPEDAPEKAVAGKTLHYEVSIESVNERKVPALDDEFAKDHGDYASLAAMKEKIKKDLEIWKEKEEKNRLKDELIRKLTDANPFEAPEGLIKKENESLLQQYVLSLRERNVNIKDPKIDWNDIQGKLSRQAEQNIRASLLINQIGALEKIETTDEDVDQAVAQIADQQHRAPEAVMADLKKEERIDSLKDRLKFSKTLDFLLGQAKINEESPTEDSAANPEKES
ncbi:MAG TPA: trigger factor [Acidobacteriota bacterium]|nr:trigger factor [Acidobacteriota bacterium]